MNYLLDRKERLDPKNYPPAPSKPRGQQKRTNVKLGLAFYRTCPIIGECERLDGELMSEAGRKMYEEAVRQSAAAVMNGSSFEVIEGPEQFVLSRGVKTLEQKRNDLEIFQEQRLERVAELSNNAKTVVMAKLHDRNPGRAVIDYMIQNELGSSKGDSLINILDSRINGVTQAIRALEEQLEEVGRLLEEKKTAAA